MECYDISNISGVDKVGSMVVFIDGEADRNSYRRFKIKTVEGANDFASLQEVLTRRLSKLGTAEEDKFPKPDLVIIDGGKGQLSAVKQIFDGMQAEGIELISLAKRVFIFVHFGRGNTNGAYIPFYFVRVGILQVNFDVDFTLAVIYNLITVLVKLGSRNRISSCFLNFLSESEAAVFIIGFDFEVITI